MVTRFIEVVVGSTRFAVQMQVAAGSISSLFFAKSSKGMEKPKRLQAGKVRLPSQLRGRRSPAGLKRRIVEIHYSQKRVGLLRSHQLSGDIATLT
jgi:hypothetical protein